MTATEYAAKHAKDEGVVMQLRLQQAFEAGQAQGPAETTETSKEPCGLT